jgi:hypothetical protein
MRGMVDGKYMVHPLATYGRHALYPTHHNPAICKSNPYEQKEPQRSRQHLFIIVGYGHELIRCKAAYLLARFNCAGLHLLDAFQVASYLPTDLLFTELGEERNCFYVFNSFASIHDNGV